MKTNRPINFKIVFPIITIATLLQFCAPTASTSTSNSSYSEDLSIYRNDYSRTDSIDVTETQTIEEPVLVASAPTHDIHQDLDSVTNIIIDSRKAINYVDGFTIQIYSGNSREQANSYKSRVYNLLDDQSPKVIYDQPNYKVRVGKYYSKLEANHDFKILKESFSRAVLIPAKIEIQE
ncbi:hypothetical protein BFP72_15285 [Reichenbachiella sp. 5M10]|uniref:SPOR domain-containing protein n=1 Tax=Reichenbachiella sp. 5M10 TaxID=1889772 RepID=UPI000C50A93B|nr:SPOR domain-containing protein [Reichenbachiella sp. 5M10]PIB36668.1 hypothetical protein BFP72_15285 [Reichenbachiella sp. 5M10]